VASPVTGDTTNRGGGSDSTKPQNTPLSLVALPLVPGAPQSTALWLHLVVLVVASSILIWLVVPRPENPVEDSAAFAKALLAWAPVLFEQYRTPRAGKKFLNHVRFLSMVQRPEAPPRAPMDRVIERMKRWPLVRSIVRALSDTETHEEDPLAPGAIPEVVLVSLSVIAERYPSWLEDPQFWGTDLRNFVADKVHPIPAEIEQALDALGALNAQPSAPGGSSVVLNQHFAHKEDWKKLVPWVQRDDRSSRRPVPTEDDRPDLPELQQPSRPIAQSPS
jgi:hypothetical protein